MGCHLFSFTPYQLCMTAYSLHIGISRYMIKSVLSRHLEFISVAASAAEKMRVTVVLILLLSLSCPALGRPAKSTVSHVKHSIIK